MGGMATGAFSPGEGPMLAEQSLFLNGLPMTGKAES
jgi:hypothetical protein